MPLPEKSLIAALRRKASRTAGQTKKLNRLITGIGDDCAVLQIPRGHQALVTTDFSLEGVHFRREWHSPEEIGWRCLARGLSDIAAMGGEPVAIFLSLALPAKLPQRWVDGFVRGLLDLASEFRVPLAGGDTAHSPADILADIVVLGSAPKGRAILRSGARPGDGIYVTGALGGSAAAIAALRGNPKIKLRAADFARHFRPEPRLNAGRFLREHRIASAMIDLSDGLSTDLAHICEESGVGAQVESQAIPRAVAGRSPRALDLTLALHGGEDYELLFTAPLGKRVPAQIAGLTVTRIGQVTRAKPLVLTDDHGRSTKLTPLGWEHFRP